MKKEEEENGAGNYEKELREEFFDLVLSFCEILNNSFLLVFGK